MAILLLQECGKELFVVLHLTKNCSSSGQIQNNEMAFNTEHNVLHRSIRHMSKISTAFVSRYSHYTIMCTIVILAAWDFSKACVILKLNTQSQPKHQILAEKNEIPSLSLKSALSWGKKGTSKTRHWHTIRCCTK